MGRVQTITLGMLLGGALVAADGQSFLTSGSAAGLSGVSPEVAPVLMQGVAAGSWAAYHDGDRHHGREEGAKERSDRDDDHKDDNHEGRRKSVDQRVINDLKQLLG